MQNLNNLQMQQPHRSWEISIDDHCDDNLHGCGNGSGVRTIADSDAGFGNGDVESVIAHARFG